MALFRSSSSSDWELDEQRKRRADYLAQNERLRNAWDRTIGSRSGLLPGATLDPFVTPRGWCGHMQATITQTEDIVYGNEGPLADAICDTYELPRGAVLVDHGWERIGDTAFIWAYNRPGVVDYHERLPHSVFGENFAGEEDPPPGQLTRLENSELRDWARKHKQMLTLIAEGNAYIDMTQVTRRYNRMRGAILDALTKVSPEEVREKMLAAGLDYYSVGEDIGQLLGMERR